MSGAGALLVGLILLVVGAEALVRGAAGSARRIGVGPLAVGLTVVAFGTSAPELVVSVRAALDARGDIAIGNVVGSNIANVLLILGLAAAIRPLTVHARVLRIDVPIVVGVSVLAGLVLLDGRISRPEGLFLLAGIAGYTGLTFALARREADPTIDEEFEHGLPAWPRSVPGGLALAAAGIAGLGLGADLFVDGAVRVAQALGVSEAVIGLTVVAVGTSLPELVTSIVAAARGECDIAVGNVVGSNVFNLLGILGASSTLRPLQATGIAAIDYGVMVAAAIALVPLARNDGRISRAESALLLAAYASYVSVRSGALGAIV